MSADCSKLLANRPAEGVLRLSLNRPAVRNALDLELVEALDDRFTGLDARVVVLASEDRAAFCSGIDRSLGDAERQIVSDRLYALYQRIVESPAIVIAALAGPAVGGGAQLAIAADLRVAAPGAWLKFAGAGHGLAVGAWGLPLLVGRGRALDLCLTMRPIAAAEAHAVGLVDRFADDPETVALELAATIADADTHAAQRIKRIVHGASTTADSLAAERAGNLTAWNGSLDPSRAAWSSRAR